MNNTLLILLFGAAAVYFLKKPATGAAAAGTTTAGQIQNAATSASQIGAAASGLYGATTSLFSQGWNDVSNLAGGNADTTDIYSPNNPANDFTDIFDGDFGD